MMDMVGYPDDRFSRDAAQVSITRREHHIVLCPI